MRGMDHQQRRDVQLSVAGEPGKARSPIASDSDRGRRGSRTVISSVDGMYATTGRPSIPPEKLLRALLIQMLYSIGSEQLLMEEIDYSVLFPWFVGMPTRDTTPKISYNLVDGNWGHAR